MKKTFFLLVADLLLSSSALFAQKFGRIDYPGVIQAMPEMVTVRADLEKVQSDYEEHLETLQVELNNKLNDFQNLPEGTSDTVLQLRQKDIQDLQQRLQQYYQVAQQGLENSQAQLMQPLQDKADAAIAKIAKAQGIIAVFQQGSVIYMDESTIPDITAAVKTELGIK